ncbi:hypothetical protein ACWDU8_35945, partial [Streptomyces sp. NPDC003388]
MRADGHAPGRPTPDGQDPGELLRRCAEDVRDVAEGIGAVAARTGAALLDPRLTGSPHRRRGTALAARWALLRALTGGQGLGSAADADLRTTGSRSDAHEVRPGLRRRGR